MKRVDLLNTEEFQAWRNGIYGHFENALHESLLHKRMGLIDWRTPDSLLLTLQDSILSAYSSSDEGENLTDSFERGRGYLQKDVREFLEVRSEVLHSLVAKRLREWHRTAIWSCVSAFHGCYESVARELRFVLEDTIQSLYADQQKPDDNIENKIQWLMKHRIKDNRPIGRILINATDIPPSIEPNVHRIYNTLSTYVHPTTNLMNRDIDTKRIYHEYVEDWFDTSYELHMKTFDLILALVVYRFPKAVPIFLIYHNKDDLMTFGFTNTLKMCNKFNPKDSE